MIETLRGMHVFHQPAAKMVSTIRNALTTPCMYKYSVRSDSVPFRFQGCCLKHLPHSTCGIRGAQMADQNALTRMTRRVSDDALEGRRTEDGGNDPEVAVLCVRLVPGRGGLEGWVAGWHDGHDGGMMGTWLGA
jgi:hypothetical protein